MNKTPIPWCDYTINPVKGLCPVACDYCYARRMYKRFKWSPEIRLVPLLDVRVKEGSRIFVGSTIELFGEWVRLEWLEYIFKWAKAHPNHTFIFLTKQPQNLVKWSPFPDNCWCGVTATDAKMARNALHELLRIEAKVKYISFEPLLERIYVDCLVGVDWVIIGSQTKPTILPKIEWVNEIITACHKAKISIFMKNNLRTLIDNSSGWGKAVSLIQEMPNAK